MTLQHNNETEVGKILAIPKKSKERRKAWEKLVNKGDFSHKFDVLKSGKGTIIPKYRSGYGQTDVKHLLPCQYCHGMYRQADLWRHQKLCKNTAKLLSLISVPLQVVKDCYHKHVPTKLLMTKFLQI